MPNKISFPVQTAEFLICALECEEHDILHMPENDVNKKIIQLKTRDITCARK